MHNVFALPCEFHDDIAVHQEILLHRHCRHVSDLLNEADDSECGCEIGILKVLHTWGQRLLIMWRSKAAKWRQVVAWDVSPRIAEQTSGQSQRDDRNNGVAVNGDIGLRLGTL
jgi:hypothetical protein